MRTMLNNRDAVDLAQVRRFIVGALSTDQAENIGEVIYVDGTAGNDTMDGKSPDRAKRTIAGGLAVAVANDVVAVFPGTYAEHVTMAVANVSLVGLGDVPRQVLLSDATALATPYISITAAGCCVGNLRISHLNAINVSGISVLNVPNCLIENCEFFLEPAGAVPLDVAIRLTGAAAECFHTTIQDCVFDGHTLGILFVANVTMPDGTLIQRCRFVNTVTTDITDAAGGVAVTLIWVKDCHFDTVGAALRFFNIDTAGALATTGTVQGCYFNGAWSHAGGVDIQATIVTGGCFTVAGVSGAAPA